MSNANSARKHKDRDFWYPHIKAWEVLECSASEYCRQHQLSEPQFNRWKSSYLKENKHDHILAVDFIPVVTEESSVSPRVTCSDTIDIHLPNGIYLQVSLSSPGSAIGELVKNLAPLSC